MSKLYAFFAIVATLVATGCATESQLLANNEGTAIQTGLTRGRFDLNCPTATGTVLSRDYIEPVVEGPYAMGVTRMEYTIGVSGCNQRASYVVICQEGTNTCFAAASSAGGGPLRR